MIYKLQSLGFILLGAAMMLGAVVGQVLWLGFCFGTVIVGLFLLFTMPMVLMWPAFAGVPAGFLVFIKGMTMWNEGQPYEYSADDALLDDARIQRQRRLNEMLNAEKLKEKPHIHNHDKSDVEELKPK